MKLINILAILLFSSCSTFNKTMFYSTLGGAIAGGFIGKSASPNAESDDFNLALGAIVGAGVSAGASYYLFREARPDIKLENSPLKEEVPLMPVEDTTLSLGALRIAPPIEPVGEKKIIKLSPDLPPEIQKNAKTQYFRKHRTKPITIEEDGKVYKIPSFEVIENGVE